MASTTVDPKTDLARVAEKVRQLDADRSRRDDLILFLRGDGPPDGLEWGDIAKVAGMTPDATRMVGSRTGNRRPTWTMPRDEALAELRRVAKRLGKTYDVRARRAELILELRGDGPPDGLEWSDIAEIAGMERAAVQKAGERAARRLTKA